MSSEVDAELVALEQALRGDRLHARAGEVLAVRRLARRGAAAAAPVRCAAVDVFTAASALAVDVRLGAAAHRPALWCARVLQLCRRVLDDYRPLCSDKT
ncbi:MAG: hypothetical protein JNK82_36130 [Myxococcaceae bacterium]|nr:hypothetical protein [Myxococcaceae bacterium]